uniref:Uncharacterized protein n=1 Tax=Panagrolaimus sp. PS1159 TaxID=55785 RepID=A0AC35FCQ5_9BILA
CVKIDIAKLSSKIWLREELDMAYGPKNFTSVVCSKLYQCEINRLDIWNNVIMFDDLQLLTSSAKQIILWRNSITYNDGKPVLLDKILESSPVVTRFFFSFDDDDSTVNVSMKSILKLKNLGKIECAGLGNLPESLSVEDISAFFKVALFFNENMSEEYKDQLDAFIDEIIESKSPNRIIAYAGQDEEKQEIMKSRVFLF